MSLDIRSGTIPASGVVPVGPGNYLFLIVASANVNIIIQTGGQTEYLNGAIAGVKLQRLKRWDQLQIAGPNGTTVSYMVGYENVRYDDTSITQTLATIAGTVATAILPAVSIATVAPQVIATANSYAIPANLARRRITVAAAVANTGYVYAQTHGFATALAGVPIGPGQFVEFDNTAAIDIRNDTGANQNVSTFEES
jgi:hypothetical protein